MMKLTTEGVPETRQARESDCDNGDGDDGSNEVGKRGGEFRNVELSPDSPIRHGDRLFANITNTFKTAKPKPSLEDNPAIPRVAYVFLQLDAHLAYEISSRVLSKEFPREWPFVLEHLLRELHIRIIFDKDLWMCVEPFNFLDAADIADLRMDDLLRLHPYALSKDRDRPFYTARAVEYPWHSTLFSVLDEMGIDLDSWAGFQAIRGPEYGPRILSCDEPIKVEVREWTNAALQMLEGTKLHTLEYYYKKQVMLTVKSFQKWCLKNGWKKEAGPGVWMPDSYGPLRMLQML
ncbi:hypothetical protein Dda_1000 [Drechslerella dactyloides]|uniref:Uncharacterized protein n=1 Tax=Drechslerella dactyloides TaxID=74499 RepID=A0AAD6NNI0_DREDA|nr:hypothetical protein Dda_1000 [Drechslerella dactyloides]